MTELFLNPICHGKDIRRKNLKLIFFQMFQLISSHFVRLRIEAHRLTSDKLDSFYHFTNIHSGGTPPIKMTKCAKSIFKVETFP